MREWSGRVSVGAGSPGLALGGQQLFLSFQPPTVTSQGSVLTDDAVTRNCDGDIVGGAGAGDGAGGGRRSEGGGRLGVRLGGAGRDGLEVFPDAELKGGGPDVQGKIQRGGRVV